MSFGFSIKKLVYSLCVKISHNMNQLSFSTGFQEKRFTLSLTVKSILYKSILDKCFIRNEHTRGNLPGRSLIRPLIRSLIRGQSR